MDQGDETKACVENLNKETAEINDNETKYNLASGETGITVPERRDEVIEENDFSKKLIIYGVNEDPPIHVTIACALQHCLAYLTGQLVVSFLVAEVVCASNNDVFRARLLSSTMFMSGVTTLLMNLFGIRLPLFQGAGAEFVIPLVLISDLEGTFCSGDFKATETVNMTMGNLTDIMSTEESMDRILTNVRALQGSLMLAGAVHAMIGGFGLVGILIKIVGPLTIVTTMILLFIFLIKIILQFVTVSWAISVSTSVVAVVLFLYLSRYNTLIPVWTPSGGCRIVRYPLHQIFAILISIVINWFICGVLTAYDVFPNDPSSGSFKARTDARVNAIYDNPWFTFPYPGQFGTPGFSAAGILAFAAAVFVSILDSIGDYYATARVCRVPPPPSHGINRGILVEGICTFISGAVGCGHGTATYGETIGTIGVSKVASRKVLTFVGILYIAFGIFGKFSAVFITIPYPVLGGAYVVMVGIFLGVMINSLEVTSMSSPRNIAILGLSVCMGLAVPTWAHSVDQPVNTGHEKFDRLLSMFLKNPNILGTFLACLLDNTVPGTRKERGMFGESGEDSVSPSGLYNEGEEVYKPLFPSRWLRWKIMKYIPFLPYEGAKEETCTNWELN
ncbi:solute carrier family 23 member 1-like [Mercenaria mercenaria]|uniref:solute carrier family 23 member 1-like n=1 Tax=Mercenaria mercenaria TaxID=6596 RepID=UPI00234F40D4|nr:solute carrier family 23 member 1-like [Mercenaria mercenaria]